MADALQSIIGKPFGHANLVIKLLDSATPSPGTEQFLGRTNAAYKITGVAMEYVTFNCPVIATSPSGSIVNFIQWNGLGTVRFVLVSGSTDTINGGAGPVEFAEADYGSGTLLLCLSLVNGYHVVAIREDSVGSIVDAISPNIQVTAGDNVDAGHYAGDGKLYLAPTISSAAAPTLGTQAVCLSDASGRTHGNNSVVIGAVTANAGADTVAIGKISAAVTGIATDPTVAIGNISAAVGSSCVAIGEVAGAVSAGAQAVGNIVSTVGSTSAVFGTASAAVGANCVVSGKAGGAVSDGGVLFGTNTSTTGAAGVGLGNFTAAIPASGVCLGNGAPAGATKLQILGIDGM
jgi:hypothetical protein